MRAGYVYLMRREDGLVKIGRSVDPSVRRYDVAGTWATSVELLCEIPTDDMEGLERAAHVHYRAARVRGEWFDLAGKDLESVRWTIARMQPLDAIPAEARAKEHISSYISRDLMERARRAAYWTPGLTVAAMLEEGLALAVERREKKRGSPFPPKDGES